MKCQIVLLIVFIGDKETFLCINKMPNDICSTLQMICLNYWQLIGGLSRINKSK